MAERNRAVLIDIGLAETVGLLPLWWGKSQKFFWKREKEVKFHTLSSITHSKMKI